MIALVRLGAIKNAESIKGSERDWDREGKSTDENLPPVDARKMKEKK